MTILGDLLKFNQDAFIELFVLDLTNYSAGLFYFHSGTNEIKDDIIWQGQAYQPLPVQASGFEYDGTKFPRPKLQLANAQGVFSTLVRQHNDLIGSKIIRKRTTARYLDAVNFVGGNPNANPSEYLPDEIFYITRKTQENRILIEFELGSSLDLQGVVLPKRQVIANICPFKYRGDECGYTGGPVADEYGNPVTTLALDKCSKLVDTGCKLRFGANGELPFGGFPGAALVEF